MYISTYLDVMYVLHTSPSTRSLQATSPARPQNHETAIQCGRSHPTPPSAALDAHLPTAFPCPRHPAYPRHAHETIHQRTSPTSDLLRAQPAISDAPAHDPPNPPPPRNRPCLSRRRSHRLSRPRRRDSVRTPARPASGRARQAFTTARGAPLLRSLPLRALPQGRTSSEAS